MPPSFPNAVTPTGTTASRSEWVSAWRRIRAVDVMCAALAVTYLFLFWKSVSRWWFNPRWSTDDALQQVFPFYSVLHPEIFEGDLIFDVMRGYLAPLHWAIGYAITWLCGDPIMTAHYMMLLQVVLAGGFLFLAVRHVTGTAPACFALLFFFHTRHVIQRMTGGLPRGWAPVLFAAFFYFILKNNHRAVLILIFAGCLLNPPAIFLVAATYGLILLLRCIPQATRREHVRHLLRLAACAPFIFLLTWWITQRPPEIGRMYTYQEAIQMPEFSREGGRFSWLPFTPPVREMSDYATRTFYGRFDKPSPFWRKNLLAIGLSFLALVAIVGLVRKRKTIPLEVWCFLTASISVYFLSRLLAFRLYVPDRHINIPFAMFWVLALSIGTWRAFYGLRSGGHEDDTSDASLKKSAGSVLGLALVGFVVYQGSGLNLASNANFNYQDTKRGVWVPWLKHNTPPTALIAGFPTFLDPVQLFSMRKAFATSETWHPFYEGYNSEMKRRIEISLRAHYARTLDELAAVLAPEGVDYFVFERKRFYPQALRNTMYFKVFQPLLDQLTSRPDDEYAFRSLAANKNPSAMPFIVYRDRTALIVDVRKLRETLQQQTTATSHVS